MNLRESPLSTTVKRETIGARGDGSVVTRESLGECRLYVHAQH